MEIQESLSPKELAEEIEEYDLVLTVEASLADAVNNYLEEEKVFTPMQLVETEEDFRRKIFLEIVNELHFTWKQVSYLLSNILSCWKHTGEIEEILDYPEFDSEETRKIIEYLKGKETPYDTLEEFEVEADSVTVLKEYQFNEIDRKILPEEYDVINSFKQEKTDLKEFKVFSSASDIAQSIKENLESLKPGEVGIAVKPGTKYEPLIKSALETEEIPYQRRKNLREDEDFRTFLSLLETGLSGGKVRIKDVRPIIDQLDIRVPLKHQNRDLENVKEADEFADLLNAVRYLDFGDVLEKYRELSVTDTKIRDVLSELDLMDEQVTEENLNSLRYYLDSFEVATEEINDGVLLADPTEVSQIDRKIVFHVGMDTDWMRDVEDKPWIDQHSTEEKNLKDFKSLIQSGESYYLVQNQELNEKILPCFYLNELIETEFSSFLDLAHSKVGTEKTPEVEGFEKKNYNFSKERVDAVSQSGLNSFVQSPRLYFMDQLVSDADQQRYEKGNLFHMYAEYHANNPETASELPLSEIVDLMKEEIQEFAEELDMENLETEFRIGIKNIRNFLSSKKLEDVELKGYKGTEDENVFVKNFPGDNSSLETEPYFNDEDLGAKGKIDLILNENHLLDYKSGRKKSVQKVLKKSHVDLFEDEKFPDFQPLLYITKHRKHVDGKIKFTFLHLLNDLGNKVNGENADLETTITYHPETFAEKKASIEVFEYLIKDVAKSNDRRKTLEKLGYQQYQNFMEERELPEKYDKNRLLKTDLAQEFEEFAKNQVGDYKYVEKGVKKTLKKLVNYRMQNYFKEDADQMETFLKEKLEEINEYLDSRFPVDANPDELPQRDLIVE